jgi:hypothetical protein
MLRALAAVCIVAGSLFGDTRVYAQSGAGRLVGCEGILIRAGSTFTVDIDMKVGGLQESITVSGDSPMIETGTSATTGRRRGSTR